MKKLNRGLLAILLVVSLLVSMCPTVFAAPSGTLITTPATGYDSADDVEYKWFNGYLINWGARGEKCDFLTTYGQDFYTGSYAYSTLSKVSGGTSASNAHSSSLYTSLQALMTDRHTYQTKYDSSSSADCKPLYQNADCYGNDVTYVSTLYRGLKVGGAWDGGKSYNQEHVWPKSKLQGTKYTDIGDIMALRAANPNENSSRNNTAYGESEGYYDPGISVRGDCARTLLYMYVRWGNTDTLWGVDGAMESLDVLLRWIEEDPVDTWEMAHNDVVQSITGTRNAFVDYPEYAYLLFGRSIPANLDTPTDGGGTGGSVTDIANATQLVTSASDLHAGDRVIIAALSYDYALSTDQRTSNRGQAAISKTTNGLSYTTDTQIVTLTAGTASGSFGLQAGDGQYLYAPSSSSNQLKTKSTLDANGSWKISISSNGAASVTACGSATRNVLRYNATSGIFSCYAASNSQKDVCIYKLVSSGGAADNGCSHSYTSRVTAAATCTAAGVRTYTCSKCGDAYTVSIAALGHNHTSKVTLAETCTTAGVRTFTCGACGDTYTTSIPAAGHSYSGGRCTVCGKANPNCSHSYTGRVTASATCTSTGVKTYTCSSCGDVYTEAVPATGHSYSSFVSIHPSCTDTGERTYRCSDCGSSYTEGIAANGHNFTSGRCSACGMADPNCSHRFSTTVTRYPTCTTFGEEDYTCTLCGYSYTESVATVGHSYSAGKCSVCGAVDSYYRPDYYLFGYINGANYGCEEDYENLGSYKFVNGKLTATFDTDSYVAVKTADNANWYMTSGWQGIDATSVTLYNTDINANPDKLFVPGGREITFTLTEGNNDILTLSYVASGCAHKYSSYISVYPTCADAGEKTYSCDYCGESYTETLVPTGHSFSGYTCIDCGYTRPDISLVTDASSLKAGDQILIVALDHDYALSTTQNSANRGQTAVSKLGGSLDYGVDAQVITLATGSVSGTFAFKVDGQYLYAPSSSANQLKTKSTLDANGSWSISISSGGAATVKASGSSTRNVLRYNATSGLFSCYAASNSQKDICIYKLGGQSSGSCSHSYSAKLTTAAGCTSTGVMTYTCDYCGDSYTSSVAATGHSYSAYLVSDPTCTTRGEYIYTCYFCGDGYNEFIPATGHSYVSGKCESCGKVDSNYRADYYLFGYINGNNYGCEEDWENLGRYKFVNGKLTATFETEGYVGIKTGDNANWYMTNGYLGNVETAVMYNTKVNANPDKLYVPGGRELTFTLTVNADDTLVLSYEIARCSHRYSSWVSVEPNCTNSGVRTYSCSLCADTYTEAVAATGHSFSSGTCVNCGTTDPNCSHSFSSMITSAATCTSTGLRTYLCSWCGYSYDEPIAVTAHSYSGGKCTVCGAGDGSYVNNDYYLFGFINGSNYGCEEDWENLGKYRFVGGKLTATFETEGYVGVKTGDNENWYMTDGWQGADVTSVVLYNTSRGINADKMYVPGGVKLTFTLTPGGDDSLVLSYVAEYEGCTHNYQEQITAAPTCTATGLKTFTCTSCGSAYTLELPARGHSYSGSYCSVCGLRDDSGDSYDYYLFGFINGADYGCESDYTTLGRFQFYSNGTCSATFASDSYVGVKKVDPASGQVVGWYMTDGWQGTQVTSARLYSTDILGGNADKLYVPGGVRVSFTLVPHGDGTLTLRYANVDCSHRYDGGVITTQPGCSTQGEKTYTCSKCGHYYTESVAPTGHSCTGGQCKNCGVADPNYGKSCCSGNNHTYTLKSETLASCTSAGSRVFKASCGATYTEKLPALGHSYNSRVTTAATCALPGLKTFTCACGASYTQPIEALGHRYQNGTCTVCGAAESNGTVTEKAYYLFGFINGMDYACGDDWENPGEYKFVGGQLTATFETDSYVAIKTGDNLNWFMAQSFVSGSSATFYDTATGVYEKMMVPGGVSVTFTLVENADGTLELSYTTANAGSSVILPNFTLKYPSLSFKDEVKLNVYFDATDLDSVVDMGLIVFGSKVSSYTVYNAEDVVAGYQYSSSAGLYVVSTHGIPAKNMGDTVWFAVYAQLSNGTYQYSKLVDYSPRTYAYTMLGSGDAKLDALLVAMLNYGTAAQTYFGYNTGSLLNNQLTSAQKALVSAYSSSMMADIAAPSAKKQGSFVSNGGFDDKYPSVTFGGAFAINYYCVPSYVPTGGITMYYWREADYNAAGTLTKANATGSVQMTGSGTYRGSVTGISAKDISDGVYVAFVYSDGVNTYSSGVLQYSIGMYCKTMAGYQNDFTPFAQATAVYGYYAKQYFG